MIADLVFGLVVLSAGYQLFSLCCAVLFARWRRGELAAPPATDAGLPPVTLLKPLRGVVPETWDTLSEVCRLDYPKLQILFGIADPSDPAAALVRRLKTEHPHVDIELVFSSDVVGTNAKVSNLHGLLKRAEHDVLVIADADIRAPRDYLRRIVPYLEQPNAGLVTCNYRAVEGRSLASRLEALFVNTDFGPMVTVARLVEQQSYAFGASICIRRATLECIGGFAAVADYLADDYQIGNRVVQSGRVSVLAPVIVETVLDLEHLSEVFQHQLRWARTYRVCRPWSYLASFAVTHTTLWGLFYFVLSGATLRGALVAAAAIGIRVLVGATVASRVLGVPGMARRLWLIPVKDLLVSLVCVLAYLGNRIHWGGNEFVVHSDGKMYPTEEPADRRVATPRPAA